MGWAPLEELNLESRLEDQFWKQKTWEGFKNETNVKTLQEAVKVLIDIVVQKQSVIKSLIDFNIKQDLEEMKTPVNLETSQYKDFITEMQPDCKA